MDSHNAILILLETFAFSEMTYTCLIIFRFNARGVTKRGEEKGALSSWIPRWVDPIIKFSNSIAVNLYSLFWYLQIKKYIKLMVWCTNTVGHVIDRLWCHLEVRQRTRKQQKTSEVSILLMKTSSHAMNVSWIQPRGFTITEWDCEIRIAVLVGRSSGPPGGEFPCCSTHDWAP